jgi:hypothetical protein
MSAIGLIRDVYSFGGRLSLENGKLVVEASTPLPSGLLDELAAEKPAVMVALGAPLDAAVAEIVEEIRPFLPPAIRRLSDTKILALVNWSMIAAWNRAIEAATEHHRQST